MHKDHIPKDILECGAPLLLHPPQDVLVNLVSQGRGYRTQEYKAAWQTCALVTALNTGIELWKKANCDASQMTNLNRTYQWPPHAAAWEFQRTSNNFNLPKFFHNGGWRNNAAKKLQGTPIDWDKEGSFRF